jgi:hypothetical protein
MVIVRRPSVLQLEEPIIRAILAGNGMQCRRIVKPQPPPGTTHWYASAADSGNWTPAGPQSARTKRPARWQSCPYGKAGDLISIAEPGGQVIDQVLLLAVRVELLQAITEKDAAACIPFPGKNAEGLWEPAFTSKEAFALRWNESFGNRAWQANPWVWVMNICARNKEK